MRERKTSELCLILLFLGILVIVPVVQTSVELRRGDKLQALDVFRERPTSVHLRAYERQMEEESVIARNLRPMAQYARFAWFKDGGDKAVLGRDGWLFYGQIHRTGNFAVRLRLENRHCSPQFICGQGSFCRYTRDHLQRRR